MAPGVAKHLNRIGAEIKRASRTISDLLDLARNQSPNRQLTGYAIWRQREA